VVNLHSLGGAALFGGYCLRPGPTSPLDGGADVLLDRP
jgi:hypothetical protein